MARARDFREMLDLDEVDLRDIVSGEGDAPERVWAAWALALRRDPTFAFTLRQAAGGDPSPGVRAHMALLLVAHDELRAAAALARSDPDALVRASACRHLARVAKPEDAALQDLLTQAMRADASPAVHAAVADGLRVDACDAAWDACVSRLADPSDEVRCNVVDALLRRHRTGPTFPTELDGRATLEPNGPLRTRILKAWIDASGIKNVLGAIGRRSASEVVDALLGFAEIGEVLPGPEVEQLLRRADPIIDDCIATLHGEGTLTLSVGPLLELVLRCLSGGGHAYRATLIVIDALRAALSSVQRLGDEERRTARRLRTVLETSVLQAASSEADRQVLTRYVQGALREGDRDHLGWMMAYDDELPPGSELLPELQRPAP